MRVTVFGAISTCLQDFWAFKLAKSTNKEDYCSFLLQIKQSVQQKYRSHKLILCYDGARAHTAKYSMDFIKDLFIPLQIPVMSCEFNCKYNIIVILPKQMLNCALYSHWEVLARKQVALQQETDGTANRHIKRDLSCNGEWKFGFSSECWENLQI